MVAVRKVNTIQNATCRHIRYLEEKIKLLYLNVSICYCPAQSKNLDDSGYNKSGKKD
jgi:hypothetical protein